MSTSFAGLEGCIIVTINLSAAIVPPDVAAMANALLYLCFALCAFVAPAVVERLGAKWSMVWSMALYSLYLAAYILGDPTVLLVSAAIGGCAGALLWVGQGVYFTRNALAYDAVCATTGGSSSAARRLLGGDSITAFAGIFACTFQLVTTLAKPSAAVLLTLYPDDRRVLFVCLTSICAVCTFAMVFVAPLRYLAVTSAAAPAPSMPPPQSPPPSPTPPPSPPPLSPLASGRCCGDGCYRCCCSGGGGGNLWVLLADPRMLLISPYNCSFGVATAFFPTHVTVLTKAIFASPASGGGGAAAVGWMYAIAGLSSAAVAAVSALAAQRVRWARPFTMLLGSAAFAAASFVTAVAAHETGEGCPCFPRVVLGAIFVFYGIGVAAWQGSCMALVGDLFRDDPRAAFAHLKLTSGICTFVGFLVLPRLTLRHAAVATLAANAFGAMGFVALLARGDATVAPAAAYAVSAGSSVVATTHAGAGDDAEVAPMAPSAAPPPGAPTIVEVGAAASSRRKAEFEQQFHEESTGISVSVTD